jgi:(p)ppGpp synthase/HD superfamily hydrolase
MTYKEQIEWIFEQHRSTNHKYDDYLPYEFHLNMVAKNAADFKSCANNRNPHEIYLAAYGHDLIEDTRVTYTTVCDNLGQYAADIIYAVTNEKGKTRKERANEKYYEGIRNQEDAVFIKLCDRLANLQYGLLQGGYKGNSMFKKYQQENEHFGTALGVHNNPEHKCFPIYARILEILTQK